MHYMVKCRVEGQLLSFLTLTLLDDWPVSRLGRFISGKIATIPIKDEVVWTLKPVWTFAEEIIYPAGNRSLTRRAYEKLQAHALICRSMLVVLAEYS